MTLRMVSGDSAGAAPSVPSTRLAAAHGVAAPVIAGAGHAAGDIAATVSNAPAADLA
ncbi:hypothetical protein [Mycobacterium persicum]|uniref:hypothetical protein n=1 Tax=Mycobacterium persicum TaxID=1487726 RepID=UPI0013015572|nr:hypothetical protein [Mycobacterium persicum]